MRYNAHKCEMWLKGEEQLRTIQHTEQNIPTFRT